MSKSNGVSDKPKLTKIECAASTVTPYIRNTLRDTSSFGGSTTSPWKKILGETLNKVRFKVCMLFSY